MKIKKRQPPRVAAVLPISNLLFSFGPTITTRRRKYNAGCTSTAATTDSIIDDVLATMATSTNTRKTTDVVPPQSQQVKRVSFCTKPQVHYILSRQDISSQEYKAAWYSRPELDSISESCLKQIHSIASKDNINKNYNKNYNHGGDGSCGTFIVGNSIGTWCMTNVDEQEKEEYFCIRGLESFTPTASRAKNMNRSSSVQAVLIEQNRQGAQLRRGDNNGDHARYDAEAIRMTYHGISASSQLWAQVVGLKDRREVEDMMMDDESLLPGEGGGGDTRRPRRVVSRSTSSSSSNSQNTRKSKKRLQLCSKSSGVPVKTTSYRLDATIPIDSDEAEHQVMVVMAIAA